jgi:hypothetical protein
MIRRLLPLVGVVIALLATAQKATAENDGLIVTGYTITEIPPIKSADTYETCGNTTAPNINIVYEYQPIGNCGEDLFMAHYTGTINIPIHDTIQFWIASDDGGTIKIGTEEWGSWQDQGCTASESGPIQLEAGPQPLDAWFYENGGGTCFMLAWNINDQGWEIVQPDAFILSEPTTTTTTSTSTTTTSTTSTTTTTTTAAPVVTTTTSTKPPQSSTTSTTTAPIIPTSTAQQIIATTSTTTVAPSNVATTTSTQPPAPQQTTTTTTSSTTTLAPTPVIDQNIDKQVLELLTSAQNIPQAKVQEAITTIINAGINNAEAQQLAASPAIIEAATPEQAAVIFTAINENDLTIQQATAIAEAVQHAPDNVRREFESAINIFSGKTDNYTAVGSRVPVRTRRIIIITTALLVAVPAPQRKITR